MHIEMEDLSLKGNPDETCVTNEQEAALSWRGGPPPEEDAIENHEVLRSNETL